MFGKMVWIVAAVILILAPGGAQTNAPQAPKKPAPVVPEPAKPKRPPVTARPLVALPDLPELSPLAALAELPELPPLPPLAELSELSRLSSLSALSNLSELSRFSALSAFSALPNLAGIALDDPDERNATVLEQSERAREKAERDQEKSEREREREQERIERENDLYEEGQDALEEGQYDRAVNIFSQAVAMKGKKSDAALYWKAYAENKLGRKGDALATLTELQKSYPKSSYVKDAKALELEVRGGTGPAAAIGQAGSSTSKEDEELKLLAINSLMHTDPERAMPILEKCLQNPSMSLKLKEKCLFVLAQSGALRAREVLAQVARGQSNPDLQRKAIQYLGLFGGPESQQVLVVIYASSGDNEVKKQILRSFMTLGSKERLLAAAKGEQDPELRGVAIQQLGVIGAHAEIWQLYQQEISVEVKEKILQALVISGDFDHMVELARAEKDPKLRLKAVRNLGLAGRGHTGDALLSLYKEEKDFAVKKEVINAFFLQGNARQLVEIARKETDPALRKAIVEKLSLMGSKEAMDYLMEILNKP